MEKNHTSPHDVLKIVMVGALPLNPAQVKGGVEAVIINLLKSFANHKDVRVIHVAHSKEVKREQVVAISENVQIRYLPFLNKVELIDYVANARVFNKLLDEEKPDIIHIQEITPHLLRFINLPLNKVIVTQHGVMSEELRYANGFGQRLKCLFKAGVERFVFPRFRNIIFISQYNRSLFSGKPENEALIFNPVNPIFLEKNNLLPSHSNTMLYVGVLSRRKNIKLVIEALRRLKESNYDFTLHVAGGFKEPAYENEVMSRVEQFGLSKQIHFHGWLSQEEIRSLYSKCPIFILPSMQETLPVSIAEAMAQGKIVVASDVGAIREMFTDRKSGFLFKRNDTDDLEKTLAEVFQRSQSDIVGELARQEAYEKFDPAKVSAETIAFYRQVCGRSRSTEGGVRP